MARRLFKLGPKQTLLSFTGQKDLRTDKTQACVSPRLFHWKQKEIRFSKCCALARRVRIVERSRLTLKCDGTRAETRFRLSAKRTNPFKPAGSSVQSTTGSQGVRISGSNAGYTTFRDSVKSTGYSLSIRQFPLHFPSRAAPCAITFQLYSTY